MMPRAKCQSCAGDGELAKTGESIILFIRRAKARIRGLLEAVKVTTRMARAYRAEGVPNDRRVAACVRQLHAYHLSIRYQRRELRGQLGNELGWCITCRGTGFAEPECDGCGLPIDPETIDRDALEWADILVHPTCDTGHYYFESLSCPRHARQESR